jgi:hypothetical protein
MAASFGELRFMDYRIPLVMFQWHVRICALQWPPLLLNVAAEWPLRPPFEHNRGDPTCCWRIPMVIKAIVEHGQIRLLEPLPAEWVEGRELRILEAASGESQEEGDTWSLEMDALTAEADDPEDWARIEAALAEADAQAKAYVRREMGLP